MAMGANAWRVKLAEKEAEERNKFGWRDIMDLLTTGFSAYQGIEGIKQGRAAQDLNERRQQFAEDQTRLGPRVPDPVPLKPPSRDEIDRDMFEAITRYGGSFDESKFEQPRPAGFPEDAPLTNRMHRGVDYGDLARAYQQPGPEPLTALDQSLIDYRNAQIADMGREGDESLTPYQTYTAMNEGWGTTQPRREVVSGIPPALMQPEMRGATEGYGTGLESSAGTLYPPGPQAQTGEAPPETAFNDARGEVTKLLKDLDMMEWVTPMDINGLVKVYLMAGPEAVFPALQNNPAFAQIWEARRR